MVTGEGHFNGGILTAVDDGKMCFGRCRGSGQALEVVKGRSLMVMLWRQASYGAHQDGLLGTPAVDHLDRRPASRGVLGPRAVQRRIRLQTCKVNEGKYFRSQRRVLPSKSHLIMVLHLLFLTLRIFRNSALDLSLFQE